jgi:hypothetical protein
MFLHSLKHIQGQLHTWLNLTLMIKHNPKEANSNMPTTPTEILELASRPSLRGGFIDKSHPDADWSGYVTPPVGRKHFFSTADKQILSTGQETPHHDVCEEDPPPLALKSNLKHGLGIQHEADTCEWTRPQRKRVEQVTDSDCECEEYTAPCSLQIGGITPLDDPDRFSSSRWQSENMKQMKTRAEHNLQGDRFTSTDLEQLTEKGRRMRVRGKTMKPPTGEHDNQQRERGGSPGLESNSPFDKDLPPLPSQYKEDLQQDKSFSLVGCRSNYSKSIFSALGKGIIAADKSFAKTTSIPSAPFATQANLPTDPYQVAHGSGRQKDMLRENFSPVVPGYTAKWRYKMQDAEM